MLRNILNLLFHNGTARQTVVKNAVWLFGGEGIGRLIRAVIVIYSARVLGAAEYGVFSYAMAVSGFVAIFSDLGISAILTRESIKNPVARQEYFSTALLIKFAFLTINTLLILFAVPLISNVAGVMPLLPLVVGLLFFDTLRDFCFGMSRALERMEWEAWVKILTNIAIAGFGLLFLMKWQTAFALSVSYVIGSALGFLAIGFILLPYFKSFVSHIRLSLIKEILVLAWPIGLLGVLGSIMINTDMLMLGYWRNAEQIGFYAAGQKPILLLYIVPTLLASAVFPVFTRLAIANKERFRLVLERTISTTFLLGLPVVTVGAVLAPALISFVYGEHYLPSVPSFVLLLTTIVVVFPSTILANALFAHNEQKQFLWFVGIGALSNAALDFYLIPRYGIEGSAIATIIAQILTNVLVWRQMKKTCYFSIANHLHRILVASLVSAALAYALSLSHLHVLINLGVSSAVYLGLLWMLKEPLFRELKDVFTNPQKV
jgi:O-antigen/teichoic acid export membrane protein